MKARIRESGGYLPSVGEYVSGDDGDLYRVTSISRDIHTASPGEANYVYGEVEAFWGDATDLEWHEEPVCGCTVLDADETGRYAIVRSEEVYTYASTEGSLGTAIGKQPTLRQAQELAREIADDYHYGVEIVDETTWTVV